MSPMPQKAPHNQGEISLFVDRHVPAKIHLICFAPSCAIDRIDGFLVNLYVGESLQVGLGQNRQVKP